jgi:hypothetical protein
MDLYVQVYKTGLMQTLLHHVVKILSRLALLADKIV